MSITLANHFHVASGLAGYGPDGSDDGYATATTVSELCNAIRHELSGWADSEFQSAESLAESGDYEAAWNTRKLSDTIDMIRKNFDPERANSPFYAGQSDAWTRTVLGMIDETFPMDVRDGNSRIYVWQCETADSRCEHLTDSE